MDPFPSHPQSGMWENVERFSKERLVREVKERRIAEEKLLDEVRNLNAVNAENLRKILNLEQELETAIMGREAATAEAEQLELEAAENKKLIASLEKRLSEANQRWAVAEREIAAKQREALRDIETLEVSHRDSLASKDAHISSLQASLEEVQAQLAHQATLLIDQPVAAPSRRVSNVSGFANSGPSVSGVDASALIARCNEALSSLKAEQANTASLNRQLANRDEVVLELKTRLALIEAGEPAVAVAHREIASLRARIASQSATADTHRNRIAKLASQVAASHDLLESIRRAAKAAGQSGITLTMLDELDTAEVHKERRKDISELQLSILQLEDEVDRLEQDRLYWKRMCRSAASSVAVACETELITPAAMRASQTLGATMQRIRRGADSDSEYSESDVRPPKLHSRRSSFADGSTEDRAPPTGASAVASGLAATNTIIGDLRLELQESRASRAHTDNIAERLAKDLTELREILEKVTSAPVPAAASKTQSVGWSIDVPPGVNALSLPPASPYASMRRYGSHNDFADGESSFVDGEYNLEASGSHHSFGDHADPEGSVSMLERKKSFAASLGQSLGLSASYSALRQSYSRQEQHDVNLLTEELFRLTQENAKKAALLRSFESEIQALQKECGKSNDIELMLRTKNAELAQTKQQHADAIAQLLDEHRNERDQHARLIVETKMERDIAVAKAEEYAGMLSDFASRELGSIERRIVDTLRRATTSHQNELKLAHRYDLLQRMHSSLSRRSARERSEYLAVEHRIRERYDLLQDAHTECQAELDKERAEFGKLMRKRKTAVELELENAHTALRLSLQRERDLMTQYSGSGGVADLRRQVALLRPALDDAENEIETLRARLNLPQPSSTTTASLSSRVIELELLLESAQRSQRSAQRRADISAGEMESIATELDSSREDLEEMRKRLQEALTENTRLAGLSDECISLEESQALKRQVDQQAEQVSTLSAELGRTKQNNSTLSATLISYEGATEALQSQIDILTSCLMAVGASPDDIRNALVSDPNSRNLPKLCFPDIGVLGMTVSKMHIDLLEANTLAVESKRKIEKMELQFSDLQSALRRRELETIQAQRKTATVFAEYVQTAASLVAQCNGLSLQLKGRPSLQKAEAWNATLRRLRSAADSSLQQEMAQAKLCREARGMCDEVKAERDGLAAVLKDFLEVRKAGEGPRPAAAIQETATARLQAAHNVASSLRKEILGLNREVANAHLSEEMAERRLKDAEATIKQLEDALVTAENSLSDEATEFRQQLADLHAHLRTSTPEGTQVPKQVANATRAQNLRSLVESVGGSIPMTHADAAAMEEYKSRVKCLSAELVDCRGHLTECRARVEELDEKMRAKDRAFFTLEAQINAERAASKASIESIQQAERHRAEMECQAMHASLAALRNVLASREQTIERLTAAADAARNQLTTERIAAAARMEALHAEMAVVGGDSLSVLEAKVAAAARSHDDGILASPAMPTILTSNAQSHFVAPAAVESSDGAAAASLAAANERINTLRRDLLRAEAAERSCRDELQAVRAAENALGDDLAAQSAAFVASNEAATLARNAVSGMVAQVNEYAELFTKFASWRTTMVQWADEIKERVSSGTLHSIPEPPQSPGVPKSSPGVISAAQGPHPLGAEVTMWKDLAGQLRTELSSQVIRIAELEAVMRSARVDLPPATPVSAAGRSFRSTAGMSTEELDAIAASRDELADRNVKLTAQLQEFVKRLESVETRASFSASSASDQEIHRLTVLLEERERKIASFEETLRTLTTLRRRLAAKDRQLTALTEKTESDRVDFARRLATAAARQAEAEALAVAAGSQPRSLRRRRSTSALGGECTLPRRQLRRRKPAVPSARDAFEPASTKKSTPPRMDTISRPQPPPVVSATDPHEGCYAVQQTLEQQIISLQTQLSLPRHRPYNLPDGGALSDGELVSTRARELAAKRALGGVKDAEGAHRYGVPDVVAAMRRRCDAMASAFAAERKYLQSEINMLRNRAAVSAASHSVGGIQACLRASSRRSLSAPDRYRKPWGFGLGASVRAGSCELHCHDFPRYAVGEESDVELDPTSHSLRSVPPQQAAVGPSSPDPRVTLDQVSSSTMRTKTPLTMQCDQNLGVGTSQSVDLVSSMPAICSVCQSRLLPSASVVSPAQSDRRGSAGSPRSPKKIPGNPTPKASVEETVAPTVIAPLRLADVSTVVDLTSRLAEMEMEVSRLQRELCRVQHPLPPHPSQLSVAIELPVLPSTASDDGLSDILMEELSRLKKGSVMAAAENASLKAQILHARFELALATRQLEDRTEHVNTLLAVLNAVSQSQFSNNFQNKLPSDSAVRELSSVLATAWAGLSHEATNNLPVCSDKTKSCAAVSASRAAIADALGVSPNALPIGDAAKIAALVAIVGELRVTIGKMRSSGGRSGTSSLPAALSRLRASLAKAVTDNNKLRKEVTELRKLAYKSPPPKPSTDAVSKLRATVALLQHRLGEKTTMEAPVLDVSGILRSPAPSVGMRTPARGPSLRPKAVDRAVVGRGTLSEGKTVPAPLGELDLLRVEVERLKTQLAASIEERNALREKNDAIRSELDLFDEPFFREIEALRERSISLEEEASRLRRANQVLSSSFPPSNLQESVHLPGFSSLHRPLADGASMEPRNADMRPPLVTLEASNVNVRTALPRTPSPKRSQDAISASVNSVRSQLRVLREQTYSNLLEFDVNPMLQISRQPRTPPRDFDDSLSAEVDRLLRQTDFLLPGGGANPSDDSTSVQSLLTNASD